MSDKTGARLVGEHAKLWDRDFRVMAYAEGHVMIRAKGVSPLAISVYGFRTEIERQKMAECQRAIEADIEQNRAAQRIVDVEKYEKRVLEEKRLGDACDAEWMELLKEVQS